MKSLIALFVVSFLPQLSQAAGPLKIDCTFLDPTNKDHLLVELLSDQKGTFYYEAASDGETQADPTEKLELKRVSSSTSDQAKFLATRENVSLYFSMPVSLVSRASSSFRAMLTSEIPDLGLSAKQEVQCSSKY